MDLNLVQGAMLPPLQKLLRQACVGRVPCFVPDVTGGMSSDGSGTHRSCSDGSAGGSTSPFPECWLFARLSAGMDSHSTSKDRRDDCRCVSRPFDIVFKSIACSGVASVPLETRRPPSGDSGGLSADRMATGLKDPND